MASHLVSDLKRLASSSGLYAVGELARRGLAFFLLPLYTRYLDPAEYGALEMLSALSSILFACIMLGLPSALTKCYHRDCKTDDDRASLLATTLALDLPVLLVAGSLLAIYAESIGRLVIGEAGYGPLVRLVVATAVVLSIMAIILASFRARERAKAFVLLNLSQFVPAMILNVVLVVRFDMGVRGVLWGNLISSLIALVLGLWVVRQDSVLRLERRLVRPLLRFGLLLVPVMLATWVIDMSDRYVLRLYTSLEEIAVYGVGYKIGMVLQMAIVWPFQLAWPAVSFSISKRSDHLQSYARVLTYLLAALTFGWLGLALLSRAGLTALVGENYAEAYRLVLPVALAYVFNGIHFCLNPGVHIAGHTRYLSLISGLAAGLNLGLNFLVVPHYGVLGAAWTTAATFLFIAVATAVLSQRVYPVPHEVGRLIKVVLAGAIIYAAAVTFEPQGLITGLLWHFAWAAVGFPALLVASGFLDQEERAALQKLYDKRPS
ncbi:MAG: oligosaccharide flippase family protein [Acidobacteriota bacterium]